MGLTNFLVNAKKGSVGHEIRGQKPLLRLMFGYQVSTMRSKNPIVNAPNKSPRNTWTLGKVLIKKAIFIFKSITKYEYIV